MSIASLFLSDYRQKILALLLINPEWRLHVRAVARQTGLSAGPVGRELNKLADLGVLHREWSGGQLVFRANQDCLIYSELVGISEKTFGLSATLKERFMVFSSRIKLAFIHGPIAAEPGLIAERVDLTVIGSVTDAELSRVADKFETEFHRDLLLQVYSVKEWVRQVNAYDPFLHDVLSQPKIFLKGDEHQLRDLPEEYRLLLRHSERLSNFF